MAYTTEAKVEAFLMIEIDSSFSANITTWIDAVTKYIERYTGRVFETGVSAIKSYDGNGQQELMIDDTIAISKVEVLDDNGNVDETLTAGLGGDYLTYPINTTPKNSIKLTDTAVYNVFPKGKQNIRITATWGYASTIPADIELVATKLVAAIVQKGLKGGEIASERLGDYSVTFIEEQAEEMGVKDTLDQYIIYEL